jgi:hypothetical protein
MKKCGKVMKYTHSDSESKDRFPWIYSNCFKPVTDKIQNLVGISPTLNRNILKLHESYIDPNVPNPITEYLKISQDFSCKM